MRLGCCEHCVDPAGRLERLSWRVQTAIGAAQAYSALSGEINKVAAKFNPPGAYAPGGIINSYYMATQSHQTVWALKQPMLKQKTRTIKTLRNT